VEETRVNCLNLDFRDELLDLVEGLDSHDWLSLSQRNTLEHGVVHHLWDFDFLKDKIQETAY